MLPAANRLARTSDIEAVFRRGRSVYLGNLGLRARQNGQKISRLAFVVSLKISKKAVIRNQLKRRLREITRREVVPHWKTGFDIVIITKKPLLDLSFGELKKLTIGLFKKAGLI